MRIICVHQSADLYGSDRSFLQVVEYLKHSGRFSEILVVLPRKGPLMDKLLDIGIEVKLLNLSLLSRTYLKKFQWGKILFPLLEFGKKKQLFESFDILYVNTSVILDFYLIAPFIRNRKVIHIREIPSKWLADILSFFIKKAKTKVIFNSEATRNAFKPLPDSVIIHNAFEGFQLDKTTFNDSINPENFVLKMLIVGRINPGKAHDLALKALSELPYKNWKLRIVGDPSKGNEILFDELVGLNKELGLNDFVEFTGFVENPSEHYQWANLLLIPSRKPESFGRIAIEAMSLGIPVIGSNHGGVAEIVEHNRNGFLFIPEDVNALKECISRYFENPNLLFQHGTEAKRTYEDKFSIENMYRRLDDIFSEIQN